MNILALQNEQGTVSVTIHIEPEEFSEVLKEVYRENAENFPVPDYAPGEAPREALEARYGETVFYGDAIRRAVPAYFQSFAAREGFERIYQPLIKEVHGPDASGLVFTAEAAIYPDVKLGQYKGVAVKEGEDPVAAAAMFLEAQAPAAMISRKLDAIEAEEKIAVCLDPVYELLTDYTRVLEDVYHLMGISRPKQQIRQNALDILLQSTSAEDGEFSNERFLEVLRNNVSHLGTLPENLAEEMEKIMLRLKNHKEELRAEERAEEIFLAYLGTLDITEEAWREGKRGEAVLQVRCDLLLDAVADAEKLDVSQEELEEAYNDLAQRAMMTSEKVLAAVSPDNLTWQLRRDKARALISETAIYEE